MLRQSTGNTQRAVILNLFRAARGNWIPLPQILELKISQFGARILELRRLGFQIENRTTLEGRKRHSWYRLEPSSSSPALTAKSAASFTETIPLFPAGLIPERWADPEEGGRP